MVVEVATNNGWVVLDALYNLYFIRPDGKLASFADVSSNWQYYKSQVPAGYDPSYSYTGVQYTNWSKIPVLSPALKSILTVFIGEKRVETLSLRSYMLRKYQVLYCSLLLLLVPLSLILIFKMIRFKTNWKFRFLSVPTQSTPAHKLNFKN